MSIVPPKSFLHLQVADQICVVPLDCVIETTPSLPLQVVGGLESYVLGLSIIRAKPVPIVNLACFLKHSQEAIVNRFVIVRIDAARAIGLAVTKTLKIGTINAETFVELPPLISDQSLASVESVGIRDQQFLWLLQGMKIISEESWARIEKTANS